MKKIKKGIIAVTEKATTKIGMILSMTGTFISVFNFIIIGMSVVVVISAFSSGKANTNRDAVISDCSNLATIAQQYFRKPSSLGGGDASFIGWTIPPSLKKTGNGTYEIFGDYTKEKIMIMGTGKEMGNDGLDSVKVTMTISPNSIETFIHN